MRILYLCRNSLAETAGGVVEYLHHLPPALKKPDIEVVLYDMSNHEDTSVKGPLILENGCRSYSGPEIKPGLLVSPRKLNALIELCKREKIDFIHAHGTYRSGFVAHEVFKRIKLPYIVMSHGDIAPANSDRMKRDKVQRRCKKILANAERVIHLTPIMAEASHQIFDTRKKSCIIANGIDLKKWQSLPTVPSQNYLFGIGRFEKEKGFHILIDAYAELIRRGVKTSLVIAGDGKEAEALHDQVKQHGLNLVLNHQTASIPAESVVFTGYLSGDLKYQLMKQSQLILFPTQPQQWEEPFGIVQIEAMAAGKPLVASDSATTRYLQTLGLQAQLAIANDPISWADQIASLLNSTQHCEELGNKNKEQVNQFDWEEIAKHYHELYSQMDV